MYPILVDHTDLAKEENRIPLPVDSSGQPKGIPAKGDNIRVNGLFYRVLQVDWDFDADHIYIHVREWKLHDR